MLDSKTFLIIIVVGFLLCLIYNDCGCNEHFSETSCCPRVRAKGNEPIHVGVKADRFRHRYNC